MSAKIIEFAEPFFLKVLQLLNRTEPPNAEQLQTLQRNLKADLGNIERAVTAGHTNLSQGDWDLVKSVLVYWADEVLTDQFQGWENLTLEQEFFQEQNRAWKFYVEADEAMAAGNSEVLEIFYLAAVLGFEGDIVDAYKEELRKELPGGHRDEDKARHHWARQLQSGIRYDAPEAAPNDEPLIGNVAPPGPGRSVWQTTALISFLISMMLFIILGGMTLKDLNSESPADPTQIAETETH